LIDEACALLHRKPFSPMRSDKESSYQPETTSFTNSPDS
jgi:hypothetical protein